MYVSTLEGSIGAPASRRPQLNLSSKIQNSCVYHNEDVTLVELTMYNVKDVCTYDTYDVAICLHYYSDETRPYKLYTSTNDVVARSLSFYRRLNTYFVPFLKKDLSPAFMQIINSYGEFIWQKVMTANEDDTEVYEYEEKVCENEEDDGYVDQFLCRRDRSLKLRASEVQLRISSDKIEMEVDSVERDGRRDKISGRSTTRKE
ncbi:PREDICTED: uncharacterized protein LOC105564780 isoform X2 [Vollenhovia emeryi]|uniref:uncharacterized protein LOC105564780 isoform X2 n=1 Tax=Vollenhovia emeryi TaxID=411798 RepID=UPI0005F36757|nr:PREDICTED: uncharacterized protein LOC105564780 isoform X2 [Vollenhovia emeryi]